ncbi:four helix bundle protein [Belliella buryatensis]|uniref:Four helix bundle protein n=1 Tax=Belliella buryatensis TaxID=1500549 RepID=A0A239EED1_9BACT|nr:four helix bundle protein [Belliella buryatensis]SNS43006.1 four helix bundle protein [Belliella buryatensis]
MHNYKELNVWKRAIKLAVQVYKVSRLFPAEERFGLISQIRRSAVSVPSNIAEGAGRRTDGEFANFLEIAHGSICELETQLYVAFELEYVENELFHEVTTELTEIQKMFYALITKFEKK